MPLESATVVSDLNTANPFGTDSQIQGDDHIRLIKAVLKQSFLNLDVPFQRPSVVAEITSTYNAATPSAPTLTVGDHNRLLPVDATAANRTVVLPSAPMAGQYLVVFKLDSSANTVTIDGNGKTINGAATQVLTGPQDFASLWYSSITTKWYMQRSIPLGYVPVNKAGDTMTAKLGITGGGALPADISPTMLQIRASDTNTTRVLLDSIAAINSYIGRRANGTTASPSALSSSDQILSILAFGYGTTGYSSSSRATIAFAASQAWTDTAQGTQIDFYTNANGAASLTKRATLHNTGQLELLTAGVGLKFQDGTEITSASQTTINLATPQNSTSGTSIDFTGIPATAKRVTMTLSGVSTSGTSSLSVQIGDSGGIENTGYLGSVGAGDLTGIAPNLFSSGFFIFLSPAAAGSVSGRIVLDLMQASSNTWAASHIMGRTDVATAYFGAGHKALSATLDRIRLTTVGGTDTFDAGLVNISYE